MVQHLVVERKVAHRHEIQPGRMLPPPVGLADATGHGLQRGFVDFAAPAGFLRKFQFAIRTDPRNAQYVCPCHVHAPKK